MRTFLKLLLLEAARYPSRRTVGTKRLSFETLGPRQLMAADAAESVEETVAEVAPAIIAATSPADISTPTTPADSPLWGEAIKVGEGGRTAMNSADGYGGYGGYGFIPPEILDFSATESTPGMWTFTGSVRDDESVYGLIVHFGGLLEGQSTMVRPDGTFELTILLDANEIGIATATVTDWDGITSEQVECAVG